MGCELSTGGCGSSSANYNIYYQSLRSNIKLFPLHSFHCMPLFFISPRCALACEVKQDPPKILRVILANINIPLTLSSPPSATHPQLTPSSPPYLIRWWSSIYVAGGMGASLEVIVPLKWRVKCNQQEYLPHGEMTMSLNQNKITQYR